MQPNGIKECKSSGIPAVALVIGLTNHNMEIICERISSMQRNITMMEWDHCLHRGLWKDDEKRNGSIHSIPIHFLESSSILLARIPMNYNHKILALSIQNPSLINTKIKRKYLGIISWKHQLEDFFMQFE